MPCQHGMLATWYSQSLVGDAGLGFPHSHSAIPGWPAGPAALLFPVRTISGPADSQLGIEANDTEANVAEITELPSPI